MGHPTKYTIKTPDDEILVILGLVHFFNWGKLTHVRFLGCTDSQMSPILHGDRATHFLAQHCAVTAYAVAFFRDVFVETLEPNGLKSVSRLTFSGYPLVMSK